MKPSVAAISIDQRLRHRRVGGDRHHGDVVAAAVLAGRRAPDRGLGDVDPVLAEGGADAADHAGQVGVAEEREVRVVELEVEALAPGLEQVRAVELAERRADHAARRRP